MTAFIIVWSAMLLWTLACLSPAPDPALPPSLPAAPTQIATPPPPASREITSLSLAATGDILLHQAVQQSAEHKGSYDALLIGTKPLITAADLAFVNLETPIAPKTGKPVSTGRQPAFNAPAEALTSLVSTGFDVVSFANNHVYDQGRPGFVETLDQLDQARLTYIGAGRTCAEAASPRMISAKDLTIAFLGTSQIYNDRLNAGPDEPCADTFELSRTVEAARNARANGADMVVLSIHWGVEYATSPTEAQQSTAHALIEGGIDLLLGHHTHVLGPIEVKHATDGRVGVIAYSLGNYVSNQSAWYEPGLNPPSAANPRDGIVLGVRVVKREYGMPSGKKVVRTELADLVAHPLWTHNDGVKRAPGAPPDISVEPLAERIVRLRSALAQASTDREVVALGTEIDELERRWKQVRRIVGEQFLPDGGMIP